MTGHRMTASTSQPAHRGRVVMYAFLNGDLKAVNGLTRRDEIFRGFAFLGSGCFDFVIQDDLHVQKKCPCRLARNCLDECGGMDPGSKIAYEQSSTKNTLTQRVNAG